MQGHGTRATSCCAIVGGQTAVGMIHGGEERLRLEAEKDGEDKPPLEAKEDGDEETQAKEDPDAA